MGAPSTLEQEEYHGPAYRSPGHRVSAGPGGGHRLRDHLHPYDGYLRRPLRPPGRHPLHQRQARARRSPDGRRLLPSGREARGLPHQHGSRRRQLRGWPGRGLPGVVRGTEHHQPGRGGPVSTRPGCYPRDQGPAHHAVHRHPVGRPRQPARGGPRPHIRGLPGVPGQAPQAHSHRGSGGRPGPEGRHGDTPGNAGRGATARPGGGGPGRPHATGGQTGGRAGRGRCAPVWGLWGAGRAGGSPGAARVYHARRQGGHSRGPSHGPGSLRRPPGRGAHG